MHTREKNDESCERHANFSPALLLIIASGQFMSKMMSEAREILQCDNAILRRLHTEIINS